MPIPERLHERICEPENQHVVHRLLTEIVIDAENRGLVEGRVEYFVELPGRLEIASERLFKNDPAASSTSGFLELIDDGRKQLRRHRQISRRMLRAL